ncbi:MAG: hypothetical protein Edafosvirus30_3 [Edafosvirus sp.]|uniref:Uncharacterized protein n=1 Tax=Edafosvirus sp. TaxID=2487765 RepID=A0A3G4ZV22_9VIRU|nr:MAG: hypothetical protein Edafosvirus30_3 [Edafosvirus sp.]
MSKTTMLVADALEYYDKNIDQYGNMFKDIKYISFEIKSSDIQHNIIHMYDKDKNEIFRSNYEVIGLFNNMSKTWTWAWSNPVFSKNTTYISKKILNYGIDLDPDVKFLKTELITSRFRISSMIQLDIHVAIASYLSKKPVIFKYITYPDIRAGSDGLVELLSLDTDTYTVYYLFILDYDKYQNV